jgi:parallel beta helix pectate lyase-like protein
VILKAQYSLMIVKTQRLLVSAIWLLTLLSHQAYADDCHLISAKDQFQGTKSVYIRESGYYCLAESITAKPIFNLHEGRYMKASILHIRVPNVMLDLQGYTLKSSADSAVGVRQYTSIKNGIIKNGIVGIEGGTGGYIGIKKNPWGDDGGDVCRISYPDCEDLSYLESIDKQPPKYTDLNVQIDTLKVEAKFRGIVLGGGNNTIRNSTIEVDGHTAIFNYGPNPIIENNTIIIYGKGRTNLRTSDDAVELMKGAIKLRDAKGGIIRNNKIIYKGGFLGFGKAPVAINLLDSKDVIIEGNTIEGFESLVRENGDTSFTEKNNKFK